MHAFSFDRAKAARSLEDPDGALRPVNIYSDADELHELLEAALACEAIGRGRSGAHLYVYPLSIAKPSPLLAVELGCGLTLLGYALGLREREGESPVEFTLRLLGEVTAQANALAEADRPRQAGEGEDGMTLLCPRCCSEEAALVDRGRRLECGNCGAAFHPEEALVSVADAEAHAELRRLGRCPCAAPPDRGRCGAEYREEDSDG